MDDYILNKINDNTNIFKNYLVKKKKYLSDTLISELFERYFGGTIFTFRNNSFDKCYCGINDLLKPNHVVIHFPQDQKTLVFNYEQAKRVNLVEPHYSGNFKEDKISFKYFDTKLKLVLNGPDFIFCSLPIDSVFIKNGEDNVKLIDYF